MFWTIFFAIIFGLFFYFAVLPILLRLIITKSFWKFLGYSCLTIFCIIALVLKINDWGNTRKVSNSVTTQTEVLKTYDEFAASIKAKYPQLSKKDNLALAELMIEIYPVYQSQVSIPSTATANPDNNLTSTQEQELLRLVEYMKSSPNYTLDNLHQLVINYLDVNLPNVVDKSSLDMDQLDKGGSQGHGFYTIDPLTGQLKN